MTLLLVFLGGSVGTAIRLGISQLQVTSTSSLVSSLWPWATFLINLSGACVLGFVLELIVAANRKQGSESRARRNFRLFFCTGVLGGYTTYGTFIVESDSLMSSPQWAIGLVYAIASVILGLCFAALGVWVARKLSASLGSSSKPELQSEGEVKQ
jgi:CrcB protein